MTAHVGPLGSMLLNPSTAELTDSTHIAATTAPSLLNLVKFLLLLIRFNGAIYIERNEYEY